MNGCAQGLALIERLAATRKWTMLEMLSRNLKSDTCFETPHLAVTQIEHLKELSRTLKFRFELLKQSEHVLDAWEW